MNHILTFLGTSTSVGIPVIGCDCSRCASGNTKWHRMRSSVHIQTPTSSILIDAGPDLRQQALRHGLREVDHVFYTHAHLDHITGFDELRAFCWRREERLPLYGNQGCMQELQRLFPWAFSEENTNKGYINPTANVLTEPFILEKLEITIIPVQHGSVETSGYKIKSPDSTLVYIPDVKSIPNSSFDLIGSPDTLIIDALRDEEHPTHMNINESLEAIEKINPRRAFFTHCAHEIDIEKTEKQLPSRVQFAYDTLQINF